MRNWYWKTDSSWWLCIVCILRIRTIAQSNLIRHCW